MIHLNNFSLLSSFQNPSQTTPCSLSNLWPFFIATACIYVMSAFMYIPKYNLISQFFSVFHERAKFEKSNHILPLFSWPLTTTWNFNAASDFLDDIRDHTQLLLTVYNNVTLLCHWYLTSVIQKTILEGIERARFNLSLLNSISEMNSPNCVLNKKRLNSNL